MDKQTKNTAKPDFTAWFVLQGTLAAMHHLHCREEGDEEIIALYELLARAVSRTRVLSSIFYRLPYRWQYRIGEWATDTGRFRHFYLRKKAIEAHARALLDEGKVTQLVVLGAGLDVLALRLARRYPDVEFIEIDKNESQDLKRSILASVPDNIEFLAGDLRYPLSAILANARAYDAGAKTLWIAEGLFMFMSEARVAAIIEEIGHLCAGGSQVIFTTVPSAYQGKRLARWIQIFILAQQGSPYRWSVSLDTVRACVERLHYALVAQISFEHLHREYPAKRDGQNGNQRIGEDIHIVELLSDASKEARDELVARHDANTTHGLDRRTTLTELVLEPDLQSVASTPIIAAKSQRPTSRGTRIRR